MRDHLLELFEYDLWANSLWIEYLEGRPSSTAELEQMAHLLGSQWMWVTRVGGTSPTDFKLPEPTLDTLKTLNWQWTEVIKTQSVSTSISYRRTTGEEQTLTIQQIASHVINHSSYHRGVLRGIALGDNRWDFPDTDLAVYFNNKEIR